VELVNVLARYSREWVIRWERPGAWVATRYRGTEVGVVRGWDLAELDAKLGAEG
jgi:hypothetical protein